MSSPTRVLAREPRRAAASPPRDARFVTAPLALRVLGAAIDVLVILVVAGVLSAALAGAASGTTQVRIGADGSRTVLAVAGEPRWLPLVLFAIVTAVYVIPLMAMWGRTLGGLCVGIRCVRADTGGVPGWGVSLRRWLLLYGCAGILALVPVVGGWAWLLTLVVGLSPAWDRSSRLRGYADRFAGDIVVRAPISR